MNKKTYWFLIISFFILFFAFFWYYDVRKNYLVIDKSIKLNISADAKSALWIPASPELKEGTKANKPVKINYSVENLSDMNYSKDDYFFRLVLGRSIDAPGFIIREFARDISAKEVYKSEYNWTPDIYKMSGGDFVLYLYMYKNVPFKDPQVIAHKSIPFKLSDEVETVN